jgi:hypothetical protein
MPLRRKRSTSPGLFPVQHAPETCVQRLRNLTANHSPALCNTCPSPACTCGRLSPTSPHFPPQTAAASRVERPNPRQLFYANDAAIAQEPADALALMVEAEAFEKDQPAMAFTLSHFRHDGPKSPTSGGGSCRAPSPSRRRVSSRYLFTPYRPPGMARSRLAIIARQAVACAKLAEAAGHHLAVLTARAKKKPGEDAPDP